MTRKSLAPALAGLLLLVGLVYWPGLSGPWLFDDFSNIRGNVFLRVTALDWQSLGAAARSLEPGPLGRPVAYLSFALNHYLHGDASPYAWKLTNVAIHGLNAVLVAALLGLVLRRLAARGALPARVVPALAFTVAALWALHPIQLSSVLYVVQRMTSLSGTFSLLALLCWLRAREALGSANAPSVAGAGLWLAIAALSGVLGAYTKETAILLPLYALLLDRVLYPDAPYWRRWLRLPAGLRLALAVAALGVVFGLAAWHYAPGYAGRPFTLAERVLTQARVLWFYIGLIALPRIDAFGLHHDDIVVSTGLLAPWTTLPAVLGIAAFALLGWRQLDRRPLVGLGILWFLAGHVLESTVVPLEIAHEHRNYLPSLGLLLAGVGALAPLAAQWRRRAVVTAAATLGAVLAATTALRADQWGDELGLSRYEVRHHPRSAQARNNLAADLVWRGDYAGAREQLQAAIELAPWEVGYPMNLVGAYRVAGLDPPPALDDEILRRIREEPLSAFGSTTLQRYSECLGTACRYLVADVVRWLEAYRDSGRPTFDRSYIEYLLGIGYREQGRIEDALNAFQRAHELDARYLHPLFAQASILLALGQWDNAEFVLGAIRRANAGAYERLDRQIGELEAAIAQGRGQAPALRILENASTTPGESP